MRLLTIGRRARLLASAALMLVAVPAFAQQETPPEDKKAAEEKAAAEAAKAQAKARGTYYLGTAPRLKRQEGPAIGAPRSILPQPYLAPGSLSVPPAPETMAPDGTAATGQPVPVEGAPVQDTTVQDTAAQDTAGEGMTAPENLSDTLPDLDAATDANAYTEDSYQEGSLASLDASGIGALAAGEAFARVLWQGYSRADVIDTLQAVAGAARSPEGRAIASRLVRSGMNLPAPEGDQDVVAFIEARLDILEKLGDTEGYVALVERLPQDRDWTAIARHITNAHLIQGRLPDACALSEAVRANDSDPYWVRMAAFCRAARGDRQGVDFQLGILEELTEIQPTFYQLIDQILIEAEQAPGSVLPAAATLGSNLRVDLLEATMARLAKVKVPALALDDVNPLAVGLMLALPGIDKSAKADLVARSLDQGWLGGRQFADFVRAFDAAGAAPVPVADADMAEDTSFLTDIELAHTAAADPDGARRLAALDEAWARAVRLGRVLAEGPGLYRLTADMVAAPDMAAGAPVLARAAALDAADRGKGDWFRLMRTTPPGANAALDGTLVRTWPLMRIAMGDTVPEVTPERLSLWWQAQEGNPARFARANLLFSLLDGMGDTVPEDAWGWLEAGDGSFEQPDSLAGPLAAPSAALWRRMLVAAHEGDRPAVLKAALKLMASGPQHVSPSLAGSLVATLRTAGFESEARALATEILIAQGL